MDNTEMTTHRISDRNWISAILLYLFLIYLPLIISRSDSSESFLQGDSFYYRAVIESIIKDGDLLIANNVPTDPLNGQLAIGQNGFVPKHPILLSVVSIPFYALTGTPGLLLFNMIDCMILMVLIFKLNSLFFDRLIAFITTILYATGTLFFDYAFNYSPDIFSTVLLLGGLYFILRDNYYSGTFLLGLSIFAKLPNMPLVAAILQYVGLMIWRQRANDDSNEGTRHKLMVSISIAAIFIVSLIPFAYTNNMLFGSPFVTGYQRTAVADENGQMISVDHSGKFNQPLLKGTFLSLFEPRNGILPTNPVLFLAVLGMARMKKGQFNRKLYLIIALCLIQFLLFAKYDEWYTSHFSNRFLMTFIALSSVFTSNFFNPIIQKYFPQTTS